MHKFLLLKGLNFYVIQLLQVELALTKATGSERKDLIALKNDLQELIELTKDSDCIL